MKAFMSDAGWRHADNWCGQGAIKGAIREAECIMAEVEPAQDQRGQARTLRALVFGNIDQRHAAEALADALRDVLPALNALAADATRAYVLATEPYAPADRALSMAARNAAMLAAMDVRS